MGNRSGSDRLGPSRGAVSRRHEGIVMVIVLVLTIIVGFLFALVFGSIAREME
jgi:Tfp pilus assembly protein PilX